jgi:hypothetical protein
MLLIEAEFSPDRYEGSNCGETYADIERMCATCLDHYSVPVTLRSRLLTSIKFPEVQKDDTLCPICKDWGNIDNKCSPLHVCPRCSDKISSDIRNGARCVMTLRLLFCEDIATHIAQMLSGL